MTGVQKQSGFTWDDERKMTVVTAAEMKVWEAYALVKFYNFYIVFFQYYLHIYNFNSNILISFVYSNSEVHGMQNKVIENWDDIVALCGRDRATGQGAHMKKL